MSYAYWRGFNFEVESQGFHCQPLVGWSTCAGFTSFVLTCARVCVLQEQLPSVEEEREVTERAEEPGLTAVVRTCFYLCLM